MFSQKDDLELIQKLDKQWYSKCHVCSNIAKYTQPEPSSGIIIDVCEEHFTYKYWG